MRWFWNPLAIQTYLLTKPTERVLQNFWYAVNETTPLFVLIGRRSNPSICI
jgi:hypothetical protein